MEPERLEKIAQYIASVRSLEGRRQFLAQMALQHGTKAGEQIKARVKEIWEENHGHAE